ncbi:MAG TPA: tetratricopeptide repeat protein [Trichocoleus sp.]
MPLITIRQQQSSFAEFKATVSFDRQGDYPITITSPFDKQEELELEWYFEEWLRFPFVNKVKAERAKQQIKTYGNRLFEQVFKSNFDIYGEYRNLRNQLSQVQIEIENITSAFQALHWEAMQDPEWPSPLAVNCIMLRKAVKPALGRANVASSPVINLLVVTARPDEEEDVGYRTISRPLVEAIKNSQLRVNIELLRPGTYEALSRHLDGKEGHYHIIHFDVHGAVLSYERLQQGNQFNRYGFQARFGREDIKAYEGLKAFLFFEEKQKGKADPVEAGEIAALLTGKGIPVCILNACQSGKQVNQESVVGAVSPDEEGQSEGSLTSQDSIDQRETSLGSRLMSAGMQMVVAMGYSITVSAASLLMQRIYSELFAERGMTDAIRLGRKELYERKNRQAYSNQQIELEDWVLPVVYVNQTVNLNLREFRDGKEAEAYFERAGRQYQFQQPTYGFVGRDLEILKLEKRLLQHNVLLLRGMGGTGKTTLLNYLREWWQTTRFAQEVFYFGYDERAWTLEQILFAIAQQVYDRFEQATFQAMSVAAQVPKLLAKLRAENYVLMLDNLESVTGQALSIPNTLTIEQQRPLATFIRQLVGGKTKVVLGSRGDEQWLQASFQDNVYGLKGLDPESRSVLAEAILQRQVKDPKRIEQLRQEEDFRRLMQVLAGYPLAMEVALANLKQKSAKEILDALKVADVQLNVGGEDKTNNILKCVEYSHSNLSESAQQLLVCLAPFSSFIDRADLKNYGKQLQQLEPFAAYPFEQFDAAIEEAVRWGLLSPLAEEMPRLLQIQPVFPFFLRTRLSQWDVGQREALYQGFKQHYKALSGQYQQLLNSKEAQERQLGVFFCRLEYENLYSALQLCLQTQEGLKIFFCLDKYFEVIQDTQSALKLALSVNQALDQYSPEQKQQLGGEAVGAVDLLASCYLTTQQYEAARQTYEKELELLQGLSQVEEQWRQLSRARTYHNLGSVAQELREYEQARSYCQQALQIYIEFNDRFSQARTYHNLGIVAQELREYEQARSYYQQALQIFIEFNDRFSQAGTYHQLGIVAQELREYEQARSYYQQALQIYIEFNDRFSQARTYHQLGIVAQELREYEQARSYYQQALQIKIEFNDRFSQAGTYHQLGIVAQALREYEQARSYYQQALQIFIEFNDRFSQARTYYQLGQVAEVLGELESAKLLYFNDLQLSKEVGDESGLEISIRNLSRFYQVIHDDEWLGEAATLLGLDVCDLKQAMQSAKE